MKRVMSSRKGLSRALDAAAVSSIGPLTESALKQAQRLPLHL